MAVTYTGKLKDKEPIAVHVSKEAIKEATKSKPKDVLKEKVDQYGDSSIEIATLKTDPRVKLYLDSLTNLDKLKTEIVTMADELYPPEQDVDVVGVKHTAKISARGKDTKLKEEGGKEALYELLGEETFINLCKFGITDLRKYLTEDQCKLVLVEERTKARTFKLK